MGCASSNLLNQEEELAQLRSSVLSQHIVSLTSTTYGLLNLDTPSPTTQPTPPPRFTFGSIFQKQITEPRPIRSDPEVINSWELMSGLDTDNSFRFCPKVKVEPQENSNPNLINNDEESSVLKTLKKNVLRVGKNKNLLEKFEKLCPPNGENRVVIYTTTWRGIRKTFEACNMVKSVMENLELVICERDISMDSGFKEQLRELMKNKEREEIVPPRVFVKGRHVGGAEEILRMVEEGWFSELIEGIPKRKIKGICEGCGDVRFLPCFQCNGSCKMVMNVKEDMEQKIGKRVVVRCPECNKNGLVLCHICS